MGTLSEKLQVAGIPFHSAEENGAVDCAGLDLNQAQIDQLTEIVSEHVSPVEYATRQRAAERKAAAKSEAALATQLKTVTAQGAVDYIETKVKDLASAKAVLKIMARMLIAVRDEVWPDMADE